MISKNILINHLNSSWFLKESCELLSTKNNDYYKKTTAALCNIVQRAKKVRIPKGKMVGEEGFEPPTNGV